MSGGVDSAVAAALLQEQGYDVVGVTLQLYDHGAAPGRAGTCCAGRDVADARRAAEVLGIPHYVLDYEARFRAQVVDDFADSYAAGETPVPCIRCNERIKFRDLLSAARDLGAEVLATGHYARRVEGPHGPELHAAADTARDQSYFLFATTAGQLGYLRFPLGAMAKTETRAAAARLGFALADKPDSQDICFVPDGDYASTVKRLRPDAARPGDIVDLAGRVLGRHAGIVHFTVGQRRGIGIGGGAPLHVVRLEPETARVVVAPRAALGVGRFRMRGLNWLAEPISAQGTPCAVRVRSTRPPAAATIFATPDGGAEVLLAAPEEGVAPGQACVAYDGSRVLGGGWIARSARSEGLGPVHARELAGGGG
jgi:tRNA-specific 2-thiouridylase